MFKRNIVAIFCEDLREEKNDLVTMVGVLPDNLNVVAPGDQTHDTGSFPVIPKLSLYVRFSFDPDDDIPAYQSRLVFPDGKEFQLLKLDSAMIAKARADAKSHGIPLAGIVIRAGLANIPLAKPGFVRCEVQSDQGVEIVGGVMFNF